MQSEEILDELVAQTQDMREFAGLTFELMENHWALADARLSAFSSEKMWAVAFEIIGYDPGGDEYASHIFLLGNCVKAREIIYLPDVNQILFTVPYNWNKEIEKNQIWGIARDQFSLLWRGQRHDFAPTLEELERAGIELSARELESGELSPQQMLRFVCEKWEHPFLMSEDALHELLDENALPFEPKHDENEIGEFDAPPILSLNLELVVQTRDWTHPKIGDANFDEGEWEISPEHAFATLAETLATRDSFVWQRQDVSKFNSHWCNWAEIEAEQDRSDREKMRAAKAEFCDYITSIVPLTARAEFLRQICPILPDSPLFTDNSQIMTVKPKVASESAVRIFRELGEDADTMLADLQNN